uniref:Cadherin domain-containing protein n=1 Tax=Sinocyclocheilus rhinocerous TaxID=307959 RepID=A0A673FQP4_9TELE
FSRRNYIFILHFFVIIRTILTMQCEISQIRSDNDETVMLHYTLRGPGANQPPVGYFVVDTYKGLVRITRPLDRDERQNYTLIGTALYANDTIAEDNIKINIVVEDQHDNPPVFIKPEQSSVYEGSPVGTFVTQVVAKDADEPNILHTKIAYSLIKQEPNDGTLFFAVDKDNGKISVNNPTLDREEHRSFVLTVQAVDMYGSPEGHSTTATVFIDILDVNDNIPTLEKDEFSASIDENEAPVEVLRIQALDNDEERTDNWLAEFEIVSGNEDGSFSIETDPKTNMGVLYLNKPVDFESASDMNLNLVVANKALPGAPLGSGAGAAGAGGASGAGGGAGDSGAGDGAGASGAGVQHMFLEEAPVCPSKRHGYDPDNWISIDTDTAEIKLNKVPDRESPFVVNGTYYAKILCITDELHSQTSTGTIALQVEDLNDNCPKLLNNVQTVCSDTRVVNVTAEDEDSDPNGAPLEFRLIQEKTKGKWNLASMLAEDDLWPGFYEVTMEIRDKQGLVCPDEQVLHLEVCTCSEGTFCVSKVAALRTTSANFGAVGISFLILGFLCLILALMAIIKCEFGNHGKKCIDMPFETKQHLISYCTDGKGIDLDPVNCPVGTVLEFLQARFSTGLTHSTLKVYVAAIAAYHAPLSGQSVGRHPLVTRFLNINDKITLIFGYTIPLTLNEITSRMTLLLILLQKSRYISENDSPKQGLKHYDYEGEGSVTGSIGNCSFIESNDYLEFLNNLGSKFNTLAEVCGLRHTDPKVIVNTVETTPNAAASSSHVTNIVQPSPEEIPVKTPLVQTEPNQGIVIQEPMYYGFNQPMASNVLLSENGLGQGVYIINGTLESGRILTQGNGHTLEHFGSGQQAVLANNIIGDSVLYSQIGPQSPAPVGRGNLLVAGPDQYPVSMSAGTPNLVRLPQVANGQVNNSQLLVNGVQNIVSGKGGQSRQLVSGPTVLEGSSKLPLAMSPGVLSPVELPQAANRQLFRSTVSRVLTSMVMMPKSKGLATNGQLDIEQ